MPLFMLFLCGNDFRFCPGRIIILAVYGFVHTNMNIVFYLILKTFKKIVYIIANLVIYKKKFAVVKFWC